jgi:hypothetical protein
LAKPYGSTGEIWYVTKEPAVFQEFKPLEKSGFTNTDFFSSWDYKNIAYFKPDEGLSHDYWITDWVGTNLDLLGLGVKPGDVANIFRAYKYLGQTQVNGREKDKMSFQRIMGFEIQSKNILELKHTYFLSQDMIRKIEGLMIDHAEAVKHLIEFQGSVIDKLMGIRNHT